MKNRRLISHFPRPLKAFWSLNRDYPHTCLDQSAIILTGSIVNALTGIGCSILPAAAIWMLQIPFRQKVAVASLFLVSCVADAVAVIRIFFGVHQQATLDTWDLYWLLITLLLEIGIGQVCVSIPVIWPLIARYCDRVKSWTRISSERFKPYGSRKDATNSYELSSKASSERVPANCDVGKQFSTEHSAFAGIASTKPLHDEFDGIFVVHTVEQDSMNMTLHTRWVPFDGNV